MNLYKYPTDDLKVPELKDFGLTTEILSAIKRIESKQGIFICVLPIINFITCVILAILNKLNVPFLAFLAIGILPGACVGGWIESFLESRLDKTPGYSNFLKYKEAVRVHQNLYRQIRRTRMRKRARANYQDYIQKKKNATAWWKSLDGISFEIEAAKLLANKNIMVQHTGGSGDHGIDMRLRIENKSIIVQCKAFNKYLSAGYVRELYGTLLDDKADEAWLITTQGYYKGAKDFAMGKPIRLFTIWDIINMEPYSPTKLNSQ